ncbi:MAG: protogloblin ApPgb [Candidatus Rokuibacteriota bacterium]|nr:MAG: protogloblin ApPgb [Candidatus Rokubacteria bacterium]
MTSLSELDLLEKTVSFTAEDERQLRLAADVLVDQLDEVLDAWFRPHPHLYQYFSSPDGALDIRYVEAVRKRSGEWILDTCRRPHDQAWLDAVHEIGLRHHRTKKNLTDGVASVPHIPLRYVIAFIYHTIEVIKPFLGKKGHDSDDVRRMAEAWSKSVILQVALWSRVYAKDGDW